MRNYPPGPRPAAVFDVLMRRWVAETFDLDEVRRRVDDARAADNPGELRKALIDEAACVIARIEELEPET